MDKTKAAVLAAFLAGAGATKGVQVLSASADTVRVVRVALVSREQPDGGRGVVEEAYAVRGERPTGESQSCAPSPQCVACFQQAADACAFPPVR